MPHNDNINKKETDLDDLLRQSLLDLDESNPDHQQLLDDVADSVFSREWPVPVNKAKEAELLHGRKTAFPKWVWILSSLILVSGLVVVLMLMGRNRQVKESSSSPSSETVVPVSEPVATAPPIPVVAEQEHDPNGKVTEVVKESNESKQVNFPKHKHSIPKVTASEDNAVLTSSEVVEPVSSVVTDPKKDSVVQEKPVAAEEVKNTLPVLSDFEISEHMKQKAAMISRWKQLKLDDYSHIHVSSGKKMNFSDFYLKRGEVSNWDYDFFLKDLVLMKKQEEYEAARPQYDDWMNRMENPDVKFFIKDYFTCSQYGSYPVVCITTAGAKLYCEWLESEIINASKNSTVAIQVRLPYDDEWRFAANPEGKSYGTENGKIRSLFGGYKANFIGLQHSADGLLKNEAEFVKEKQGDVKEGHLHHQSKVNFTTTAMAFMMNNFGLFNMSGNVSEMVLVRYPEKNMPMRTIGGNWHSEKKFLEIKSGDEFNYNIQASPFIGFRPEVIITSKAASKK